MDSKTSERGSAFSSMSESARRERIEAERGFQFLALCEERGIGEARRARMERIQLRRMIHTLHIS